MKENSVLITKLIDSYEGLQRIRTADDPIKETEFQLRITKAKLEAMGISTDELKIDEITDIADNKDDTGIPNKVFNGIIKMILRNVENALKSDDLKSELEELADILRVLIDDDNT